MNEKSKTERLPFWLMKGLDLLIAIVGHVIAIGLVDYFIQ